ncbi:hypothetical protein A3G06_02150 [Candidatus Nomurabacteria bacterium RIFCSPLOWO2_12_FULL_46_14]|uniref:Type 4 fimbrial biogenesis protein PilX N-terminal domain-containing protein n=1 Tax=Candidatus Nomurabacteria bacterium RIFCSPLOWO2_12_FULL_46_14 TaxID=1801797 RepID=A0A1F6YD99_9BACT|nr:MAG: hypothetical protein A3G06_02150 [Candidatus Nomurabacteria bacterium RIFCSPLOWO2_12_FULL_46_14]
MIKKIFKNKSAGFVILYAVIISSMVLAIALGVLDIAYKEIKFSTSARDTNDAFFAADTGLECALFNDKSTGDSFVEVGFSGEIVCRGGAITLNGSFPEWDFIISQLGSVGESCARVNVKKDTATYAPDTATTITSSGYNNGGGNPGECDSAPGTVIRELQAFDLRHE